MENIDIFFINRVIHDFKGLPLAIKPYRGALFRKFIDYSVMDFCLKGMHDILFAYTMPKCRLVEFNRNLHVIIVQQNRATRNGGGAMVTDTEF